MSRPNFFLVGAPRCGTTKLHGDLAQHPQVFMSQRKEPHYFSSDITEAFEAHQKRPQPYLLRDLQSYLKLFDGAQGARVVGESSVYYLYSDAAVRNIHAFAPDAKILVLLRDPAEFLHSLHGRLYSMGDETAPLERALALEDERRAGRRIPKTVRYPGLLFYSDYTRFRERIELYRQTFSPRQVHVELLEDLRREPQGSWARILAFLEVDPVPIPAGTPKNERVEPRSRLLASYLRQRFLAGRWNRVDRRLQRMNTRAASRSALLPETRRLLQERLRSEVEALGQLLERDLLTLWNYRKGAAGDAHGRL